MNTYKTLTIILSIIVVTLLGCIIHQQRSELYLSKGLEKLFIKEGFDKEHGEILPATKGREKLTNYITNRRRNVLHRFKKSTYGYFFGLAPLNEFMQKVNSLDLDNNEIIGVRVYRGISEKNGEQYFDTFMIPVAKDGKNYPKIDLNHDDEEFAVEDGFILNTSAPCPNNCDDGPGIDDKPTL